MVGNHNPFSMVKSLLNIEKTSEHTSTKAKVRSFLPNFRISLERLNWWTGFGTILLN